MVLDTQGQGQIEGQKGLVLITQEQVTDTTDSKKSSALRGQGQSQGQGKHTTQWRHKNKVISSARNANGYDKLEVSIEKRTSANVSKSKLTGKDKNTAPETADDSQVLYVSVEVLEADPKQIYIVQSKPQEVQDDNCVQRLSVTLQGEEDDISTTEQGKEINKSENEKIAQVKDNTNDDFMFILKKVQTNRQSFSYDKLWLQCFHCQYKTETKTALIRHMHNQHKDLMGVHRTVDVKEIDKNSCEENVKVMKMSTYDKVHSIRPVNTNRKKVGKMARKRNVEKQDLPGTFTCPQCNKVFSRLRYLRKHIATHRTERKYLCDECGKGFTTKTYLTHHRKIHVGKYHKHILTHHRKIHVRKYHKNILTHHRKIHVGKYHKNILTHHRKIHVGKYHKNILTHHRKIHVGKYNILYSQAHLILLKNTWRSCDKLRGVTN